MGSDLSIRGIKSLLRRVIIRSAIKTSGRSVNGRKAVFDEFAITPGYILHRDGVNQLIQGGDHVIWCRADDRLIAEGLIKHGHWQRHDFDAVAKFLETRKRLAHGAFVNVGANIGTQVLYALLNSNFARVVAYEPEPENFATLVRNVATNALSPRARLLQSAVSDHAGTLNLRLNRERPGMHHIVSEAASGTVSVPSVRLADSLAAEGIMPADIGLIWIDVEGHERAVFRGMGNILEMRVPILFEYSRASTSDSERRAWCDELQRNYSTIATVEQGMTREMPFLDAFEEKFTNLLVC